ncbi:hypothetical protein Mapa_015533 [Marchantia paleacea]|nr:hypothetical protein Mapa_015533 [Marchantia paleacea]
MLHHRSIHPPQQWASLREQPTARVELSYSRVLLLYRSSDHFISSTTPFQIPLSALTLSFQLLNLLFSGYDESNILRGI